MNVENLMSRLCNRIMSASQNFLDTLNYVLEEMEVYANNLSADREDIKACIDEIKEKIKHSVAEHWVICNNWAEHFDGIEGNDEPPKNESSKPDPDSVDGDNPTTA